MLLLSQLSRKNLHQYKLCKSQAVKPQMINRATNAISNTGKENGHPRLGCPDQPSYRRGQKSSTFSERRGGRAAYVDLGGM